MVKEHFLENICTEPERNKGTSRADTWGRAVEPEEAAHAMILRWDYIQDVQKFEKASVVNEGLQRMEGKGNEWREAPEGQVEDFKIFCKDFVFC